MLTIKIDTGDAAYFDEDGDFCPEEELARNLRYVIRRLEDGATHGVIHDVNGNKVGSFELTDS